MWQRAAGAALHHLIKEVRSSLNLNASWHIAARAACQNVPRLQTHPLKAKEIGAVEKTRTSTGLPPQRPQRCASTIPPRPHTSQQGLHKAAGLLGRSGPLAEGQSPRKPPFGKRCRSARPSRPPALDGAFQAPPRAFMAPSSLPAPFCCTWAKWSKATSTKTWATARTT